MLVDYFEQKKLIELGLKIRKRRNELKISQAQLAFEANLTREFINKIENGKLNISIINFYRICRVLNCEEKDLI